MDRNTTKPKLFLIMCLAFIIGVGFRSVVSTPFIAIYALCLAGIIVTTFFWQNHRGRLIGFLLIFFSLGVFRYDFSVPRVTAKNIQFYNNQEVRWAGIVSAEPDVRKDHLKLTTNIVRGLANMPALVTGKVLVKTNLYPEYRYGDLLDIKCQLQTPETLTFESETGERDFAYDKYLARYGIYSVCYRPEIKVLAHDQGNMIMSGLLWVKNRFMQAIGRASPEPQASFLGGLVLGAKKSIPDDLMESFSRTGTTHIVALSGYNITIIGVLILNVCRALWISRKKSFGVSLGAIAFFVLVTGAQASVVRAGIMGMLVLLATQLGRLSRITNALAVTAVIMVLVNPKVLLFDTGFQLSFLATIGLVYLSPLLERWLSWLPSIFEIKSTLIATLSAIIMTSPLILWQFGRFSLVAPLVNVLILPAIPIAMGLGFITGILSLIWLPVGQVFGWLVWTILSYIIFVVEKFSAIDLASFSIGNISWAWLVLGYGLLGIIIIKKKFNLYGA
jgi:competence protein ComEC